MAKTKRQRETRKQATSTARRRVKQREAGGGPMTFRIPEGFKQWKFEEKGTFKIRVYGYIVGKGNPYAVEDEEHYERTFYTHPNVGPKRRAVVCPTQTYDRSCAICKDRELQNQEAGKDEEKRKAIWSNLGHKERQLFIFGVEEDDYEPKYIFEGPCKKGFGEKLDEEVNGLPEDDPKNHFYGKEGYILEVKTIRDKYRGNEFFPPATVEITDEEHESEVEPGDLPCLDDLLIPISPADLEKMYYGEDSEEEESEEEEKTPKKKPKKKEEPEEEEEEEEDEDPTAEEKGIEVGTTVKHKKLGKCEVVHVSGDGTSLRLKDGEGEVHRAQAPKDCKVLEQPKEEEEEEEEEETPKKKSKTQKKKPKKEEPEEEEESEDDDWDDSPFEEEEEEESEEEEEEDLPKKKKKK